MNSPEYERVWTALGINSDRITALEATVGSRNEMMRESIMDAVQAAMPKALLSDEEHAAIRMLIAREEERSKFRKKVIDSSVAWAVPVFLGGSLYILWTLVREYLAARGLWRP